MKVQVIKNDVTKIKTDLLILGLYEGSRKTTTFNKVNKILKGELLKKLNFMNFKSSYGSVFRLDSLSRFPAKSIMIIGLGKKDELIRGSLFKISLLAANKLEDHEKSITLDFPFEGKDYYLSAILEGLLIGSYNFKKYKTKGNNDKEKVIKIHSSKLKKDREDYEINHAHTISNSVNKSRDLVNEPPDYLTPTKLSEVAIEISEEGNLECSVYEKEQMLNMGMGGIIAVSKGSDEPPKFIHILYKPRRKSNKNIAVVGKGITYDSGGLCIKPADSMRTMKMDMAGAAAVIGVMKAISVLKPPIEVHGIIPATENMTGGSAYKPDDVLYAMNGKTIEVINTDAEGRIALADALSFAVDKKIDEIIDLATLTGACIVGLGSYTAGIMGNNENMINKLLRSSKKVGEKMWQLPLDDELRSQLDSTVADVKNVGSRWGGAITAALFLENFVSRIPWVHIDIAGPAFFEKGNDWNPTGGTGFGVRTVVDYILNK